MTTLIDETISEGSHQLQWNATGENGNAVSSGIYFLKMVNKDSFGETANASETIRLGVVK